ncbi:MAG TPA: hypothetical protein VKC34_02065 [Blastocatellia bacterium]|nr:hypothetical protein [Blastocatellia bacterium]
MSEPGNPRGRAGNKAAMRKSRIVVAVLLVPALLSGREPNNLM